jgi:2-iminoacetate synthase ThiH
VGIIKDKSVSLVPTIKQMKASGQIKTKTKYTIMIVMIHSVLSSEERMMMLQEASLDGFPQREQIP